MDVRITHPPIDEKPRILVVASNKSNLAILSRRLTEAGYRISPMQNAQDAAAELHRVPVNLVLAELDMPRMSGAELTRVIRDEVMWRDIPVMLITGKSDPKNAVRAYGAGADDVILKPFHFEVLFARIERRIERARLFRQLTEDNAALDARVVERAIESGELKHRLAQVEASEIR